jgi:hypothetical protein
VVARLSASYWLAAGALSGEINRLETELVALVGERAPWLPIPVWPGDTQGNLLSRGGNRSLNALTPGPTPRRLVCAFRLRDR